MLFSQLIYTGCGKDKTGAFSVWSKSSDITKIEENEIREKMLYKRPTNLPYEPSSEELEELFPKKMGYFLLSSGRYCIAQSVYIGKVYSDLDQRTGNYIIHAYVFDSDVEILPMLYMNSDIFKKGLTYQEWHDQEAPAELPKVSIKDGVAPLSNQEIQNFFNEDKINKFGKLLQSVINSLNSNNKVTFHDSHKNLKYWYKAISLCLPSFLQKKATFSTFYTPALPTMSQMQSNQIVDTEVKIRNISSTISSSIFSYRQEANGGKYAFDFEANIIPNVEIGNYVKTIVDIFKSNIFGAPRTADILGKICLDCNVDLDTSVYVFFLKNLQVDKINNIEILKNTINICKNNYSEIIPNIANKIYEYGFKNNVYKISPETKELYELCYQYSKLVDRQDLIEKYILNQSSFGVNETYDYVEYVRDFINKAPFDNVDFIGHLFVGDNLNKYANEFNGNFSKEYLLFTSIIEGLKRGLVPNDKFNLARFHLFNGIKCYIEKRNINYVCCYVEYVKKFNIDFVRNLVLEALESICRNNKVTNVFDINFLLDLINRIDDDELSEIVGKHILLENIEEKDFVVHYSSIRNKNTRLFEKIEEKNVNNPEFIAFFNALEIYKFENDNNISRKDLEKYYDKYVTTGQDKGIFLIKLKQYLISIDTNNKLNECSICYLKWYQNADIKELDVKCGIKLIADIVFKLDVEILKNYIENQKENIATILFERLKNESYIIPDAYYAILYGKEIKEELNKIKTQITNVNQKDIINNIIRKISKDEDVISLVVDMYKKEVVELFLCLLNTDNAIEMFENMYQIFYNNNNFMECFKKEISKLSEEKLADLVICLIIYVNSVKKITVFATHIKERLNSVLGAMNSGKRKKIFALINNRVNAKNEKIVNEYLEIYQKTHESVFNKVFGSLFGKSKKEDKSQSLEENDKKDQFSAKKDINNKEENTEGINYKKEKTEENVPKVSEDVKVLETHHKRREKKEAEFDEYKVKKSKVMYIYQVDEEETKEKHNKR